jgi:hypothetical protein
VAAETKERRKKDALMPTREERLRHVVLKLKRAKEHIADLNLQISAFFQTNPYRIQIKRDPETRKPIYYMARVDRTPDCLALIAGDAIQNLMSALDHLAYQLVCSDTSDNPPNRDWIYFPIRNSAEEYETSKRGKMKGAHEDTFAAIDALKPYKGGNDQLWALYRLNNIEKHRLLITVGSVLQSINLGAFASRGLADFIAREHQTSPLFGKRIPVIDAFFGSSKMSFPLKVGDVVLTGLPDSKDDENLQVRFNVALYEPEILEAQSILETLHQMTALVEGIVTALTPRLAP